MSPPRTARSGVLWCVVVTLLLSCASVFAQEDRARLTLKVGLEHDSNAQRLASDDTESDQLTRVFFRGHLQHNNRLLGSIDTKLLLGAKAFRSMRDENAFISAFKLNITRTLLRHSDPLGGLGLYLRADLSDRSERLSTRDYTRAGLTSGLFYRVARLTLSLGGGYRIFFYKPDPTSHHEGATLDTSARVEITEEWSASAQYMFLDRRFEAERLINQDTAVFTDPTGTLRRDALHALSLSARWSGPLILQAGYALQINESNSVGPGLLRHTGTISWTQPLPWGLTFDLQGQLQRTQFDDTIRIDETLRVDNENRNFAQATLSYAIYEPLNIELRYALYTQAFGAEADFIRQLFFTGLSVNLDSASTLAP